MSVALESPSTAVGEVLMSDPEARKVYAEKAQQQVAQELQEFQADVAEIKRIMQPWEPISVGARYLQNRMEGLVPTLKSFFDRAQGLAAKAAGSRTAAEQLKRDMGWYTKNKDAKALVKLTLTDLPAQLDRGMLYTERTLLGEVRQTDEDFFQTYLNAGRPPMRVYRGDGRGVNRNTLNNYVRQAIAAEGTPDVSFFGVVQHIESSSNKNGMVSTTTDRAQAMSWALDGKKFGLLYTFDVSRYIDTIAMLRLRNFKHRFPAQLEILVPTQIPVSAFVSVELYDANNRAAPIAVA